MSFSFRDRRLAETQEKIESGIRLNYDDGLHLLQTTDIHGLGYLARTEKEKRTGKDAFYIINRQVNPTNICVLSCKFCEFAKKPRDDDAYEMTIDQVLSRVDDDLDEVHIVGGLHPTWPYERYVEIVREIRRAHPAMGIKAWTAVEIDFFTKLSGKSAKEVLQELKDAGLDAMPGGGAEVFSENIRQELYPFKMGEERWFEIHRIAHSLGIPSNCTLLFGHIETLGERVIHILKLRDLMDETRGFHSFIPLTFQVGNTGLRDRETSALDRIRTIATSRLLLDNFIHIKAYWVMLGESTAEIALLYGADDLDGTIREEKIAHAAGARSAIGQTEENLKAMIEDAGFFPRKRNIHYQAVV